MIVELRQAGVGCGRRARKRGSRTLDEAQVDYETELTLAAFCSRSGVPPGTVIGAPIRAAVGLQWPPWCPRPSSGVRRHGCGGGHRGGIIGGFVGSIFRAHSIRHRRRHRSARGETPPCCWRCTRPAEQVADRPCARSAPHRGAIGSSRPLGIRPEALIALCSVNGLAECAGRILDLMLRGGPPIHSTSNTTARTATTPAAIVSRSTTIGQS